MPGRHADEAAHSPRQRMNHNLHNGLTDPIQRLAIAMEPATYIRPLRHQAAWLLQPSRRPATDPMLFTE
ncbi:MAG: WbuC family cupin fold metalloprotein [Aeromonas popoffii]|uniref:WbuC family cupin fold metalloprotein n=1 Tax=Aeromonas popoffii TaxID=70856 RepID=UPI003F413BAC